MPLQATSGAASYDAFGGGVAVVPNYIEDVFSTWLYTGTNAALTITNGIDLSTKGGLVWIKNRTAPGSTHVLTDTVRGAGNFLQSNGTGASINNATSLSSFSSTGFSVGAYSNTNGSGNSIASWTFREQPKFFDVVTYTGTGSSRTVVHNLGAVPGCIMVKRTDVAADWQVYHTEVGNTSYLVLNSTAANASGATRWNNTSPTSTVFSVGTDATVNASGGTYVAYLFAHNAGGFGLSGADNVITCGRYEGTGSPQTINLGYEAQFVLVKITNSTGNWYMFDNMRGMPVTGTTPYLLSNTSGTEATASAFCRATSTGFVVDGDLNINATDPSFVGTYIYIAIRRGPMKVPTTSTSVFQPNDPGPSGGTEITTNFTVDAQIVPAIKDAVHDTYVMSRLQGVDTSNSGSAFPYLFTNTRAAEATSTTVTNRWSNTGFRVPTSTLNLNAVFYSFRRAPGFFDVVCYTGTGSVRTVTHNLGVAPELLIVKSRSNANTEWNVYAAPLGATQYLYLQATNASAAASNRWNNTAPTSSVFTVSTDTSVNGSGYTLVAYLFATCPGVNKVANFTGTGALQTIDCGFTAGSRFILIKRTDAAGDWYVWDSSRGLGVLTEPYLLLNSTAAEVGNTNWVGTTATGFQVTAAVGNNVNINGASYIALAIA